MITSAPKIAIVIPNYNHADELKYSLHAILNQSRPADEIIVVDDGSTDNSIEIIEEFSRQFASIRLIRNMQRKGVIYSVNRGITCTKSEFIILASADERIMPDMCETMETAYMVYPDASLFVSKFTEWNAFSQSLSHGRRGEYDFWFT